MDYRTRAERGSGEDLHRMADLHVHTKASDGTLTPSEVVRLAWEKGLGAIGITDHDTIGGLEEAVKAGREMGVTVVPGVEINTDVADGEAHILGYFVDYADGWLASRLEALRNARTRRAEKMVSLLRRLGYSITLDAVMEKADGGAVGRPHVADVLVEKGYFGSRDQAFAALLARGKPGYVPREKIEPAEAVRMVLKAGGVPVWAHPGLSVYPDLFAELVDAGLKGLEVVYPDHDEALRQTLSSAANQHGLLVTGGSDYHGPHVRRTADLGAAVVPVEVVDEMRRLARGGTCQNG